MDQTELQNKITAHQKWLNNQEGGAPADFQNTDLQYRSFENLILRKANFQGANLNRAKFKEVDLTEADFSYANLTAAKFEHTIINGAKFKYTDLDRAEFIDVDAQNTNLNDASGVYSITTMQEKLTQESNPQKETNPNATFGCLIFVMGLLFTLISFSSASGGGTYIIAWGAMLTGAIMFFKGMGNS